MNEQYEAPAEWYNIHDRLPAIDVECIVLDEIGRISFGHMVNKEIAVDYDGWNIPGVVFWAEFNQTEDMKEFYENNKHLTNNK